MSTAQSPPLLYNNPKIWNAYENWKDDKYFNFIYTLLRSPKYKRIINCA